MDTGCARDLVPVRNVVGSHKEKLDDDTAVWFRTANGSVVADRRAWLYYDELDLRVQPFVLEETPWVLPIGKRCVYEDGV